VQPADRLEFSQTLRHLKNLLIESSSALDDRHNRVRDLETKLEMVHKELSQRPTQEAWEEVTHKLSQHQKHVVALESYVVQKDKNISELKQAKQDADREISAMTLTRADLQQQINELQMTVRQRDDALLESTSNMEASKHCQVEEDSKKMSQMLQEALDQQEALRKRLMACLERESDLTKASNQMSNRLGELSSAKEIAEQKYSQLEQQQALIHRQVAEMFTNMQPIQSKQCKDASTKEMLTKIALIYQQSKQDVDSSRTLANELVALEQENSRLKSQLEDVSNVWKARQASEIVRLQALMTSNTSKHRKEMEDATARWQQESKRAHEETQRVRQELHRTQTLLKQAQQREQETTSVSSHRTNKSSLLADEATMSTVKKYLQTAMQDAQSLQEEVLQLHATIESMDRKLEEKDRLIQSLQSTSISKSDVTNVVKDSENRQPSGVMDRGSRRGRVRMPLTQQHQMQLQ
jgi:chromosome segregation ATPase